MRVERYKKGGEAKNEGTEATKGVEEGGREEGRQGGVIKGELRAIRREWRQAHTAALLGHKHQH